MTLVAGSFLQLATEIVAARDKTLTDEFGYTLERIF